WSAAVVSSDLFAPPSSLSCRPIIATTIRGSPSMLDVSRADLVAGVAGSGTMGRGIVQVLAHSGVRTLVFDSQPGAAAKALASIEQTLARLVERGKLARGAAD